MDITTISIISTALLAILGWFVSHRNARALARSQEKLKLVNKRLNEFYGPLYVTTRAGYTAHKTMLDKLGRSKQKDLFDLGHAPTEKEIEEWIIWMKKVFMPLNDIRERIIINNAYLLIEKEIPNCLLDFLSHVAVHRALIAKWEKGSYKEIRSPIEFPLELAEYASKSFQTLKEEQEKLIGLVARRSCTQD